MICFKVSNNYTSDKSVLNNAIKAFDTFDFKTCFNLLKNENDTVSNELRVLSDFYIQNKYCSNLIEQMRELASKKEHVFAKVFLCEMLLQKSKSYKEIYNAFQEINLNFDKDNLIDIKFLIYCKLTSTIVGADIKRALELIDKYHLEDDFEVNGWLIDAYGECRDENYDPYYLLRALMSNAVKKDTYALKKLGITSNIKFKTKKELASYLLVNPDRNPESYLYKYILKNNPKLYLDNDETNTNVPKPVNMPSKAFIYCLVPYYFQLKKKNLSGEQLISRINKDVFDKDVIYDVNLVDKYFFYLLTYEYFELSKFKEGFKFAANLKNDPRLGPLFGRYILKDRFRNQLAKSIFRYDLSNIRKASYLDYDNLEHCKITEKQILLLRKDKYNVKRNMPVRLPSIFELLNKHMTNSEVEKSIKELLITKDFVAVVRTLDEVIKSEKEPSLWILIRAILLSYRRLKRKFKVKIKDLITTIEERVDVNKYIEAYYIKAYLWSLSRNHDSNYKTITNLYTGYTLNEKNAKSQLFAILFFNYEVVNPYYAEDLVLSNDFYKFYNIDDRIFYFYFSSYIRFKIESFYQLVFDYASNQEALGDFENRCLLMNIYLLKGSKHYNIYKAIELYEKDVEISKHPEFPYVDILYAYEDIYYSMSSDDMTEELLLQLENNLKMRGDLLFEHLKEPQLSSIRRNYTYNMLNVLSLKNDLTEQSWFNALEPLINNLIFTPSIEDISFSNYLLNSGLFPIIEKMAYETDFFHEQALISFFETNAEFSDVDEQVLVDVIEFFLSDYCYTPILLDELVNFIDSNAERFQSCLVKAFLKSYYSYQKNQSNHSEFYGLIISFFTKYFGQKISKYFKPIEYIMMTRLFFSLGKQYEEALRRLDDGLYLFRNSCFYQDLQVYREVVFFMSLFDFDSPYYIGTKKMNDYKEKTLICITNIQYALDNYTKQNNNNFDIFALQVVFQCLGWTDKRLSFNEIEKLMKFNDKFANKQNVFSIFLGGCNKSKKDYSLDTILNAYENLNTFIHAVFKIYYYVDINRNEFLTDFQIEEFKANISIVRQYLRSQTVDPKFKNRISEFFPVNIHISNFFDKIEKLSSNMNKKMRVLDNYINDDCFNIF